LLNNQDDDPIFEFQPLTNKDKMSWITIAWSMMASSILTLALLHLFIWFHQTRQWAHLFFSIAAFAVAVTSGFEFLIMRAVTIEQMASLLLGVKFHFL